VPGRFERRSSSSRGTDVGFTSQSAPGIHEAGLSEGSCKLAGMWGVL